jgi:hypothetical protein
MLKKTTKVNAQKALKVNVQIKTAKVNAQTG